MVCIHMQTVMHWMYENYTVPYLNSYKNQHTDKQKHI